MIKIGKITTFFYFPLETELVALLERKQWDKLRYQNSRYESSSIQISKIKYRARRTKLASPISLSFYFFSFKSWIIIYGC
ncbi:unnamed protein product [Moneuplotes crassus]|uniref:Uncharacterized protein n=1 Tax=Euplotes crassus TaxID=5936 RepID=A0AAD1X7L9_EUPCR|nr:unnamed protein product [Moneuplotes crassus]